MAPPFMVGGICRVEASDEVVIGHSFDSEYLVCDTRTRKQRPFNNLGFVLGFLALDLSAFANFIQDAIIHYSVRIFPIIFHYVPNLKKNKTEMVTLQ